MRVGDPYRVGLAAGEPFGTDHRPDARLRLLVAAIGLCLSAVPFRLVDLQADADVSPAGPGRAVRSIDEPVPARDGRILSADGRVLAEDVESFSVLVHYRWLERPADARWVRGEALRLLGPAERRDPDAVTAAEREVLRRREALWGSLSDLTGVGREELFRRFAAAQDRVAAVRRSVEEHASEERTAPPPGGRGAETWWLAAWEILREAVTTPPRRDEPEPVILAEEAEHYVIASGLPLAVAAAIEADPERHPATRVRVESRRRYPLGATAAHVVGYRFPRSDRAAAVGGSDEVTTGQSGVERTYDRHLRGISGVRRLWLDRRGEVVRAETLRAPRVGRDLVLHLNAGLQAELERLLDEAIAAAKRPALTDTPVPDAAGGCVVAIDVRTGAVLAAASAPRFDPGPASRRDRSFWREIAAEPAKPMFDRVASAALPPGSVFKIVSAVVLLESGKIDPDEPIGCVGYLARPDRHRDYVYRHFGVGHGPTTLTTALAQSCNVYFFHAARKIGAAPFTERASCFGFGRATGIDLPAEAAGHLSSAGRDADSLGLAIGQADLTATPLQIVRMTAAVANGGRLVTPHVVRGSGPARRGDDPARPLLTADELDGLNPDTLSRIREGMEQVVSHPQGSGYKTVRHPRVAIAGKTGTAEVGGGRPDHAWFAGYAPADDPQVAFVVLLEHAGSGGAAAGPLARATVDALLRHTLVRP